MKRGSQGSLFFLKEKEMYLHEHSGANGYWTGGSDLTNLGVDPTDIITSDNTEFKWDSDGDVFWR